MCGLWAGLGPLGCAAADRAPSTATSPATAEFVADWDDLPGAADIAAQHTELAIVRSTDPTGRGCTKRFELLGVSGEPGTLTVTRPEPCTEAQAQPLAVEVRIGRFGDPAREASFLKAFRARLERLRGRDYAPVR